MKGALHAALVSRANRLHGQGGEMIVFGRICLLWCCFQQRPSNDFFFFFFFSSSSSSLFSVTVSPPPSLMAVMWMLAVSPLLVCEACCGLSVVTFNSAPPPGSGRAAEQTCLAASGSACLWGRSGVCC